GSASRSSLSSVRPVADRRKSETSMPLPPALRTAISTARAVVINTENAVLGADFSGYTTRLN
ncbi:MAG: hypothetical protein OEW59_09640, partial [Gammaproteobacteria bacterium]|nr:hypothetical protein [Gammaproteobacteria bacterium]